MASQRSLKSDRSITFGPVDVTADTTSTGDVEVFILLGGGGPDAAQVSTDKVLEEAEKVGELPDGLGRSGPGNGGLEDGGLGGTSGARLETNKVLC